MDLGSLFFLAGAAYLLYLVVRYSGSSGAETREIGEPLTEYENMVYKAALVCEAEKVSFTCENPECLNTMTAYVRDGKTVLQEGTTGNCEGELELECGKCCWLYQLDEYLEEEPVEDTVDEPPIEEAIPASEKPALEEIRSRSKYL
jgi:hypothetical protein